MVAAAVLIDRLVHHARKSAHFSAALHKGVSGSSLEEGFPEFLQTGRFA